MASHKTLSRAEKFASGELAEVLAAEKKRLFDVLAQRVKAAQTEETKAIEEVRRRWEEKKRQTDARAAAMYEEGCRKREREYEKKRNSARRRLRKKPGWRRRKSAGSLPCVRQNGKRKRERKKKRMLLTVATALVCFALFLLMVNVVISTRKYKAAEKLEAEGKHFEAAAAFFELAGYERCPDALERSMQQWENIAVRTGFGTGYYHVAVLNSDGTVSAKGQDGGRLDVQDWTDMVAIAAGESHTVGLKADGSVVAVGDNFSRQLDVQDWADVVAISAGCYHTLGLKPDGTAVAVGNKGYGRIDVTEWSKIPVPQR